jgi:tripartite-type tricarboxylate transporter receptor subunit TctC
MKSSCFKGILLGGVLAGACVAVAQAQSYPTKPIRTVLTVAGGVEVAVRALSTRLTEYLGQPVIIDAQSAAGGAVGASMVARSAPDGYTIAYATTSAMVLRPFLTKNTPYDAIRDFTPITQVGEAVAGVMVSSNFPARNMKELVEYAKTYPGKISYGTSGVGTTHHLSGEMLQLTTGIKIVHVPYKSGGQSFQDLVSGQVQLLFGVLASSSGFIESGKVRLLAINGNSRYPRMPDVPTVVESIPGYDRPPGWMAYLGPAGMPAPIARRLHAEIVKGMQQKDVVSVFDKLGLLVETSASPEAFAAEIKKQLELSGRIVKIAGIEPE